MKENAISYGAVLTLCAIALFVLDGLFLEHKNTVVSKMHMW